jgi:LysM repeat protein
MQRIASATLRTFPVIACCGLILWLCLSVSTHQAQPELCTVTRGAAVNALQTLCAQVAPGSACYAHPTVTAALKDTAAALTFAQPGEQVRVDALQSLMTVPFTEADAEAMWGLAVMQPVLADGTIFTAFLMGDAAIHFEDSAQTPHVLTVRTEYGAAGCVQTPSLVALNTPEGQTLELNLNATRFRLTGALLVFQQQSANSLAAVLVRGTAEISATSTPPLIIQPGQTALGIIDGTGTALLWSAARPMNADETEFGQVAQAIYDQWAAAGQSGSIVSADSTPAPEVVNAVEATTSAPDTPAANAASCTHTVARGETLFRIATRYRTTVRALGEANRIVNVNLLSIGQQLTVPCDGAPLLPDTSSTPVPTAVAVAVTPAPSPDGATCPEHTVARGENLFRIALRYKTTVQAVATLNNLANPRLIYAGQTLKIPC